MAGEESPATAVSPFSLWFSQRSAGGNNRAEKLRQNMREQGFVEDTQNPVNVVRTPQSLTTIDNTRVAIAQELGISEIKVVIHNYDDPLPEIMIKARRLDHREHGARRSIIAQGISVPHRYHDTAHLNVRAYLHRKMISEGTHVNQQKHSRRTKRS